ncbi:11846_t:CDS:2, partial [Gigaspora margarita]
MLTSNNPTPLEFFRFSAPTKRIRAFSRYRETLQIALNRCSDDIVKERLQVLNDNLNDHKLQCDWEQWMQEKTDVYENVNTDIRRINEDNNNYEDAEGQISFVINIFQETIAVSQTDKELVDTYRSFGNEGSIMDLRPCSRFALTIDTSLYEKILHQIFDPIDELITEDLHKFLAEFFNKHHSPKGWDDAVDEIVIDETDSEIISKTKKLLKRTLVQFFKAFSLNALNPLRDLTTLEKPHLNQFVHPVVDAALWIFGRINYVYGEIPIRKPNANIRADGVGYINEIANYAVVVGEGARPGALKRNNIDYDVKIVETMVGLYNRIILSEAHALHQFTDLRTYGITVHQTEVCLLMLDFRGIHRLFEVDRYFIPKDWSEMPKFVEMYEAIVKWA